MSLDTQEFVRHLVANVRPVQPLPSPWMRAAYRFGIGLPAVGLIVSLMSASGASPWAHIDRRLVLQQLAALATGVTAAAAAFATTVPGYPRWIALTPLVPLAVWLSDLGQSCIQDGLALRSSPLFIAHWACLLATIVVGAFPAATIVMMLRRGVPLTPRLTTVLAAVATGGLGNFGVRFVHAADASIVVLVWHVAAVLVLSAISASVGRSLFNWRQLADRNPVA